MDAFGFLDGLATAALLVISWDLRSIKERMKELDKDVAAKQAEKPRHGSRNGRT